MNREKKLASTPLPFKIRTVRTEEQLFKAVSLRSSAYERHWPNLATTLQQPETQDRSPNSIIFLAESKEDLAPLGTLRIDTNLDSSIPIEAELEQLQVYSGKPLAYVTRLGVRQGKIGTLVKLALFKALYRYCLAKQFHWILVGVRPPSDREYKKLGFYEVYKSGGLVPLLSSGGIPVRVLAFDVIAGERQWHYSGHPLYEFVFNEYHPDIEIFSSVSGVWSTSRRPTIDKNSRATNFNEFGIPII